MAFNQFPEDQVFIVLTDDEWTSAGSFTTTANTELAHMVCTLFKLGPHSGTETLQVSIHGNSDLTAPIVVSDPVYMADIDSLTSSNWSGRVLFDFSRTHIDLDNTYYIGIKASNYSYIENTYYWSFALDWPDDINTPASESSRGLQFALLGYS